MFKLMNGDLAPPVRLRDSHGEVWDLEDHRGKMVILHFGRGEY